jgi:hypothetical protein
VNLLAVGADSKTPRGVASRGILTGILYMTPAETEADALNFCTDSSAACRRFCINVQGRGVMNAVQRGRARKRAWFVENRAEFLRQLERDCHALVRGAARLALQPASRLNGTSDVAWELLARPLIEGFPSIRYYDYTKVPARYSRFLAGKLPPNYHLTFSRSEDNEAQCLEFLRNGGNVAVVFGTKKGEPLPESWHGYPVIDGDVDDYRPADPVNVVVGLRAKGSAKKDRSGFVVWAPEACACDRCNEATAA